MGVAKGISEPGGRGRDQWWAGRVLGDVEAEQKTRAPAQKTRTEEHEGQASQSAAAFKEILIDGKRSVRECSESALWLRPRRQSCYLQYLVLLPEHSCQDPPRRTVQDLQSSVVAELATQRNGARRRLHGLDRVQALAANDGILIYGSMSCTYLFTRLPHSANDAPRRCHSVVV